MAVNFGTSNTDRHYTVPDSPLFDLPNGDWTWLIAFKANSSLGYGYYTSIGGTYGGANSLQIFNSTTLGFAVKVGSIADRIWGGGQQNTAKWAIGYATRRSGNLYAGCGYVGEPSSISEGTGTAISAAYSPATSLKIGIRSDLSSDASYSSKSIISDVIYLPGVAFSNNLLKRLLVGEPLDRQQWFNRRVFHAYLPNATSKYLVDLTGRHALTQNGTGYTRGITEKDHELRRFSDEIHVPAFLTAPAAGSPIPVFRNHYINQGFA